AEDVSRRLRVTDVLHEVNRFLRGRRGYAVVAESGDMLFAGLDVRVERDGGYLAQGYYASMGFGVPGALGAEIATGLRPLVLCGDGAFQMTGPEIAHAPRYGLKPIVLLINNGGWQIFRPVAAAWPAYDRAAPALRAAGRRVPLAGPGGVQLRRADRRLGDRPEPGRPLLGGRGRPAGALDVLGPQAGEQPLHERARRGRD